MSEQGEKDFIIEQLQHENARLQHESMCNILVNNFTELMYGATSVDEVLEILYYSLPEVVSFQRIIYFHVDRGGFKIDLRKSIGYDEDKEPTPFSISLEDCQDDIADAVFEFAQIDVDNGIEEEDALSLNLNTDRYMLVPLVCKGLARTRNTSVSYKSEATRRRALVKDPLFPTIGIFLFDTTNADDRAIGQDISVLSQFIHIAGIIIDNIAMMENLKTVNVRINAELDQARKVQEGLLPSKLPSNEHITAAVHYTPEEKVGGDYYDLFSLEDNHYGILIADVSGHGASSALVMAMMKALLRTFATRELPPAETFEKVNDLMVEYIPANKFVTSFYAIVDCINGNFCFSSAGHCTMLLVDMSGDEAIFKELKSSGFFIGVFPELGVEDESITFEPGCMRLIVFTDGVTEAMDKNGEQYGQTRLQNSTEIYLGQPPKEAVKSMIKDMERFVGDCPLDDDVTLMVVDF